LIGGQVERPGAGLRTFLVAETAAQQQDGDQHPDRPILTG
jgi:hypothetical protein